MSSDKSTGQIAGGIIGATVGYIAGGPTGALYGYQIGSGIGGYVDPPPGPTIDGPRLQDLSAQTASYGAKVPRIYGTLPTFGTVFWLENNQLKEVVRKEKQGGKGGGGSATLKNYTYYATFAVSLCEGPIAGVKRVWINGDLIYNAGSSDLSTVLASNTNALGFNVYTGEDDQEVDARMQADVGASDCPRYPGLAYIVFYDLELTDYGNTLAGAQIKAEVVTNISTALSQIETVTLRPNDILDTTDGSLINGASSYFKNGTLIAYYPKWDNNYLTNSMVKVTRYPGRTVVLESFDSITGGTIVQESEADVDTFLMKINGVARFYLYNVGYQYVLGTNFISDVSYLYKNSKLFFLSRNTDYIGRMEIQGSSDLTSAVLYQTQVTGADSITSNDDCSVIYALNSSGIMVLDADDLSVIDTYSLSLASYASNDAFVRFFDDRLYITYQSNNTNLLIVDADDGTLLDTVSTTIEPGTNIFIDNGVLANFFDSEDDVTDNLELYVIQQLTDSGETLSTVVSTEMQKSNIIESGDIDATDLTDTLRGFRIPGIGRLRGALSPLQGAYPFDFVPSGYQIKCVRRGNSSVATVTDDDLNCRAFGGSPGIALEDSYQMDSQLPKKLLINHLDPGRNGDINQQFSPEKNNTTAVNIREIEMPLSLTADEAAQIAEQLWDAAWLARNKYTFNLPPTYLSLEPSDVITVTTDYANFEFLIDEITQRSDGVIEIKRAQPNIAALWSSSAVGGDGNSGDSTIEYSGDAVTYLLDIPMIRDSDDGAGYGIAMGSGFNAWPGGVVFRSTDNEQTFTEVQAFAGVVPIGITRTALSQDDGYVIDNTSQLQIDMICGSLSSITQAQMLTGLHWCAYGVDGRWELMRYITATLEADGSYTLTGLLRGCRGTEWATGLHAVGDVFIFLDDSDTAVVGANLSDIGVERHYRGVSVGQDIADVASQTFTYNGVNLEPLSPVLITASLSSNDWTINAYRRSRFTSSVWTTGVDYVVGEDSEAYEIDFYYLGQVVDTLTGISSLTDVSYTEAQQLAGVGFVFNDLVMDIYQISAQVGRGYAGSATISGGVIDADFDSVSLLLRFNEAEGSTNLIDESNNAYSINESGDFYVTETDGRFARCGVFNGSTDFFRRGNDAMIPATDDWTFECFFKVATVGTYVIIAQGYLAPHAGRLVIDLRNDATVRVATAGGADDVSVQGGTYSVDTWHYLAAKREGTTFTLQLDDTEIGTDDSSDSIYTGDATFFGRRNGGTSPQYFNGKMDSLRITNGVARDISSAPISPYPLGE